MDSLPPVSRRALGRATLARQLLLTPSPLGPEEAVHHLLGLQAQNTKPPYYALAARLDGFRPEALSALMESRAVARIATLRSTVHTHTARDAVALRAFAQPGALDRGTALSGRKLAGAGVDLDRLGALARDFVEAEPRTPGRIRERLLAEWPDADPEALVMYVRCLLPLVQATPRGLWGRSGQVALTTTDVWFGGRTHGPADADETVLRYLGAFGPASVKDMQTWCGVTRLRPVFERLRPRLLVLRDEDGTELFDLPDAPRPDASVPAPPRLLPEFDNLLLSHADRRRFVPDAYRGRTWTGNQAHRVLLLDGSVAGLWYLEETGKRVTLTVAPFGRIGRADRAGITTEAERVLSLTVPEGDAYDLAFRTGE
ncbi:winged helix DNA-binding domain-containing protein [Streptomyces sp. NPDC058757]|uniref:winged helix DNA-binding domain-containing protein n=1 Tax=unclassified Streptomyces TaxID=2593676 RepID=UPI0036BE19BF